MPKKSGWYTFLAAIAIAAISIYWASSPAVLQSPESEGSPAFSASNAYQYLQEIAKAPHSMGTAENQRVRSYITTTCKEMGLVTDIQHTVTMVPWGRHVIAGNVHNIVARLKGQHSGKAVLVAAHYDSQPNAPGAGDDGAGVAAMLETARLLKSGKPLKNDVIFLFTDGEEDGLLGAHAFVEDNPVLKEVGIMLNFEGRGNCGISTMFETNPGNGWVVAEFARSAAHPFANSLNYEVYKRLPNNTDYSLFKNAGVPGLNSAFIEGFVNYHSMTDKPGNLDMRSFQDHGDNMLCLVQHFGNIDLSNAIAPDLSYFNILGDWLIRYPASWNLFLLVLGNIALVVCIMLGFVKKRIAVRGFIGAVIGFPLVLAALYFVSDLLLTMIRSAYPLYDHFYASNSYNAYYYFFALAALAFAIFTGVYQWMLRKFSLHSLLAGILLIEVAGMDVFYTLAPSAIYFLFFPLLSTMIFYILTLLFKRVREVGIADISYALPALLLIAPVVYYFFVAFGLESTSSAAVVVLGLLLGLLLPVLASVLKTSRWLIPACSLGCFLVSMAAAHLQADFTDSRPLQTNLRYLVNADEGKAYWISDQAKADRWNRQFFPGPGIGNATGGPVKGLINEAPLVNLSPLTLVLEKDTLENGLRRLRLRCQSTVGAISARMLISGENPALAMEVNGKEVTQKEGKGFTVLEYKGLTPEGFTVECRTVPGKSVELDLFSRSMGLPQIKGWNTLYPADIIPGPGYNSNTTQVVKHYRF